MKIKRNWKKVDPKELEGVHRSTENVVLAYVNRHNPEIHVEVIRGCYGEFLEIFYESKYLVNLPFGWINRRYDTKKQAVSALKNWMVDNPSGGMNVVKKYAGKRLRRELRPQKPLLRKVGYIPRRRSELLRRT